MSRPRSRAWTAKQQIREKETEEGCSSFVTMSLITAQVQESDRIELYALGKRTTVFKHKFLYPSGLINMGYLVAGHGKKIT